jgi:signal transduction histidine kinase
MFVRPISSLWLRLALPFLLFVAAGSTALALWLHAAAQRESRHVFATLARTNANFIKSARLPANEHVADYLGHILNMHVFFRRGAWNTTPGEHGPTVRESLETIPPVTGPLEEHRDLLRALGQEQGIVRAGADFEAIAVPLENDLSLILVREVEPAWAFLVRTETLSLLVAFWVFSVALAWVLASGFVRPLRLLAERLPHIESDPGGALPGAERADEIGQLARAYLATRAQLAEERTRREQAERLALLGRMATGLAHEIHNPLAAIRMHAQLIDSSPAADLAGAARASLPVLLGETARIEGLVNQWMFLARPAPPHTVPTDLTALVADVVRTFAPQAAHARVEIIDRTAPALYAKVDARRLTQAIGNVVLNAIHALPGGGTLVIEGSSAEVVRLSFRDTGAGFSTNALAHHAELFFSEKEGGMGIGLSVTSEILRAHGGSLQVANAPEGGAIVTFVLPVTLGNSAIRNPQSAIRNSP